MKVYAKIASVQAALSKDGIGKTRRNQQQGYAFRGIDEVFNTLAPLLSEHGLVILPRCLARTCTERETKNGAVLFYVVVEAEFDFVAAEDGSKHTVRTFGEAMDSADKATNKAMSAAYKYAAIQAFCIPTEGDNDADTTTHGVAPQRAQDNPTLKLLADIAGHGTAALKAAWERTPEPERAIVTNQHARAWEGLKQAAKTADELKGAKRG